MMAADHDGPVARLGETGAGVERRRLAGAVGADQPRDPPLGSVQADAVYGDEAAEANGQVLHPETARDRRSRDRLGLDFLLAEEWNGDLDAAERVVDELRDRR